MDPAWAALCERLGGPEAAAHARVLWAVIDALHRVPQRAYHNLDHVRACLRELDRFEGRLEDRDAAALALWFHDAIYEPGATDNEARSAEAADLAGVRIGLPRARRERVRRLIMATTHKGEPDGEDARAAADIDLAVLGAPWEEYRRYAAGIRAEHSFADDAAYAAGRAAFLRGLLERGRIFRTEAMHVRLDRSARANMERELKELGVSA